MNQHIKTLSFIAVLWLVCLSSVLAVDSTSQKSTLSSATSTSNPKPTIKKPTINVANPALPTGNTVNQGTVTPDVPPRPDSNGMCPAGYFCHESGVCGLGNVGPTWRECRNTYWDCAGWRSRRRQGYTMSRIEEELYDKLCND